jgi:hypothetical protein
MFKFGKDKAEAVEQKLITKADKAKHIFEEMIKKDDVTKVAIIERFINGAELTKAGALTYFNKLNKQYGFPIKKLPTKMDKAREIYTTMTNDEESRKAIVGEFIKQIGLSKAAANTYYQMIKKKSPTS